MGPLALAILLASGAGVAGMGLGQIGKWGERGVMREQIAAKERMSKAQTESTKRLAKESEARAKEYMQQLLQEKRKERISERETQLMQSFIGGQDRQMALVLQAIQGISQTPFAPSQPSGAGMLGLLRSKV